MLRGIAGIGVRVPWVGNRVAFVALQTAWFCRWGWLGGRFGISQQLIAAVLIANANSNLAQEKVSLALILLLFDVLVRSYLSLAPAYAVVGAADPVAAWLWYLPMGLTVVQAASLVPGTYRGISLCQVGHVAVESSPRVGEVK